MLVERLTQPLSKKLLWSLLLVSVGSDLVLYFTRFSYLAETLYTNILLFGIIVGIKLAPRLSGLGEELGEGSGPGQGSGPEPEPEQEPTPAPTSKQTKKRLFSVFTKAFFLFYILNLVNNIYISESFTAFNESADLIAEDFSSMASEFEEAPSSTPSPEMESTTFYRAFDWIDTVGFDFFDSFIAGLEEVWRLSYIVLFLALFKKIFPKWWQRSNKDSFLILAIILSSFLFGVGHSLAVEQEWNVFVGTVVNYTNMGLILGYLLISTRNLWLLVFIHGLYNVLATISWHYMTFSLELFILLILTINWLIINLNRRAVIPTNYAPQNKQA